MEKEMRTIQADIELRESEDGKRTITGYAIKWGELSQKLGFFRKFREKIQKGAFTDSLKADRQYSHWNHNTDTILGSTESGSLRLFEDEIGLRFENDLPNTTDGNNAYELVKRGDIRGVSFGFSIKGQEWDDTDDDNIIRTVTKGKLYEISPTPYPAYPQTEVSARNIEKSYEDFKKETTPDLTEQRKWFFNIRKKLTGGM